MKKVSISIELMNAILNYIQSKPLGEVLQIFTALTKELADYKDVDDKSSETA